MELCRASTVPHRSFFGAAVLPWSFPGVSSALQSFFSSVSVLLRWSSSVAPMLEVAGGSATMGASLLRCTIEGGGVAAM